MCWFPTFIQDFGQEDFKTAVEPVGQENFKNEFNKNEEHLTQVRSFFLTTQRICLKEIDNLPKLPNTSTAVVFGSIEEYCTNLVSEIIEKVSKEVFEQEHVNVSSTILTTFDWWFWFSTFVQGIDVLEVNESTDGFAAIFVNEIIEKACGELQGEKIEVWL